jgi:hypothetical protein
MVSFVAGWAHSSGGLAGRREVAAARLISALSLLSCFWTSSPPLRGYRMCGHLGATFVPGAFRNIPPGMSTFG